MLHFFLVIVRWGALIVGILAGLAGLDDMKNQHYQDISKYSTAVFVGLGLFFYLPTTGIYQPNRTTSGLGNVNIEDAEYGVDGKKPFYIHIEKALSSQDGPTTMTVNDHDDFDAFLNFKKDGNDLDIEDDDVSDYWNSSVSDVHYRLSDHNRKIQEIEYGSDGSTRKGEVYELIEDGN